MFSSKLFKMAQYPLRADIDPNIPIHSKTEKTFLLLTFQHSVKTDKTSYNTNPVISISPNSTLSIITVITGTYYKAT